MKAGVDYENVRFEHPLEQDTDFVLVQSSVVVPTASGEKPTSRIWLVYLLDRDIEVYLCPYCLQYGSTYFRAVLGHLHTHADSKPAQLMKYAAAFLLLPPRIQRQLIRMLEEQHRNDDPHQPVADGLLEWEPQPGTTPSHPLE